MYTINKGWASFVTGVINNIGWIIVIILSLLTMLFTQLGTWHREEGSLSDLYSSYEEYGIIHHVTPLDVDLESNDLIKISTYYENSNVELFNKIEAWEQEIILEKLKPQPSVALIARLEMNIANADASIETNDKELQLITSRNLKGISEDTLINPGNQRFSWVGEYQYDKILKLATTDVYSWVLVLMLSFSAIIIKVQGNKTGKMSGFKMVWRVTARHARLSEKIAPRSKDAEDICIAMNKDELRIQRESKLQYASMDYYDVFTEEGRFLSSPKFVEVETEQYKKLNGKTILRENPYHKKLLKKQKKAVEALKKYRVKEVHTFVLLESKSEAKERYDFGESIKVRERKTLFLNIVTSLVTVLPMFTAASVFVLTENSSNLLVGALGTALNFVSLLFNMFGSYEYIINSWAPNLLKKCDTLLVIANQLGLADDIDNNWDAIIEKELIASNQK